MDFKFSLLPTHGDVALSLRKCDFYWMSIFTQVVHRYSSNKYGFYTLDIPVCCHCSSIHLTDCTGKFGANEEVY